MGTPALTTRGMKEEDMREVASLIASVVEARDDKKRLTEIRDGVIALSSKFPLYRKRLVGDFVTPLRFDQNEMHPMQ